MNSCSEIAKKLDERWECIQKQSNFKTRGILGEVYMKTVAKLKEEGYYIHRSAGGTHTVARLLKEGGNAHE